MQTWWLTPAIIGGLMMWGKSKASAAYRWINSEEDAVKALPVALLLTKISTGDTLPPPPTGYTWKPIEINFASSPFASPQSLTIEVMEPVPTTALTPTVPAQSGDASAPVTGASGFLTSQSLLAQSRTQTMDGFLSKQALERGHAGLGAPPVPANWCGTGRYTGSPAGNGSAFQRLGSELRAKGLVLAPVGPHGICSGDFVVTTDGALYRAVGHNTFQRIHPAPGPVGPLPKPFQAAYGLRRA